MTRVRQVREGFPLNIPTVFLSYFCSIKICIMTISHNADFLLKIKIWQTLHLAVKSEWHPWIMKCQRKFSEFRDTREKCKSCIHPGIFVTFSIYNLNKWYKTRRMRMYKRYVNNNVLWVFWCILLTNKHHYTAKCAKK